MNSIEWNSQTKETGGEWELSGGSEEDAMAVIPEIRNLRRKSAKLKTFFRDCKAGWRQELLAKTSSN